MIVTSIFLLFAVVILASDALPHFTLSDFPYYNNPCYGDLSQLTERARKRCQSKFATYGFGGQGLGYQKQQRTNNIYCKVFHLCLNFSFGNLYLSSYGFWRSHGYFPQKNYAIHAIAGANTPEPTEIEKPSKEAIKLAIQDFRRNSDRSIAQFDLAGQRSEDGKDDSKVE